MSLELSVDKAYKLISQSIEDDKTIKVVTHNDTDGLTSYIILKKMFEQLNANFDIEFVPVLNEITLLDLDFTDFDVIVFADLGSSSLDDLCNVETLCDKDVIILDHHYPLQVKPPFNLVHVNPNLFGYKGDSSACGATLSYLLARKFGFKHLAKYALAGAIGDAQASNTGKLEDFNLIPIYDMGENLICNKALQVYGKFSRPLLLSLKYSSNIFSDFGESDNNILAFLYKIKKETGIDIQYQKPYSKQPKKHMQILARYLYTYMKKFVPSSFHKFLSQCLYGFTYHLNVEIDKIFETPWKYDFEEIPSFLNASIRIGEHELVTKYLEAEGNHYDKPMLDNYRKYKRKLSKAIRKFDDLCEYDKLSNIQYYISYMENDLIESSMTGVLAAMLYTKPEFDYTKPNIGIKEFDGGWKISIRGSKLLQFTDFHAGKTLIQLAEKFGGSAGGHQLAAGCILPEEVDLNDFLTDLDKLCKYKVNK